MQWERQEEKANLTITPFKLKAKKPDSNLELTLVILYCLDARLAVRSSSLIARTRNFEHDSPVLSTEHATEYIL